MAQNDTVGITSGQITVGATTVVGITVGQLCSSLTIKLEAGGGTCTMVGQSLLTTKGYGLDANIPMNLAGHPSVWINEFAGVTSVISWVKTLTGFTAY